MPKGLPLSHSPRRNSYVLAMKRERVLTLKGFEGGQSPLYRRLPKRGFSRKKPYELAIVNIEQLQLAIDQRIIDASVRITEEELRIAGIVKQSADCVKLLAKGKLTTAVTIEVWDASSAAVEAVEQAGGRVSTTFVAKVSDETRQKVHDVVGYFPDVATSGKVLDGMRVETTAHTRKTAEGAIEVLVELVVTFNRESKDAGAVGLDDIRAIKQDSRITVFSDEIEFTSNEFALSEFDEIGGSLDLRRKFSGIIGGGVSEAELQFLYTHGNRIVRRFSQSVDGGNSVRLQ
jgi:large subunit ribosomal protein L15